MMILCEKRLSFRKSRKHKKAKSPKEKKPKKRKSDNDSSDDEDIIDEILSEDYSPLLKYGFGIKTFITMNLMLILCFIILSVSYMPLGIAYASWPALADSYLTMFTIGNMGESKTKCLRN